MKKLILASLIVLLLMFVPSLVLAQGIQQQKRVQDPSTHLSGSPIPQGNQQDQGGQQQAGTGSRGIETAVQSLNRVAERNNNPEIGEQVRSMAQNHEKVQTRTKTALQKMSQRNQAVKFLIGPDYKNAGQVRKDVVGLRNDIKKLEQVKKESLPADAEDIQGAIDELQVEADGLDTQLTEQLSGFSLFGWLAKLFAN